MRASRIIIGPLFALLLVAGCDDGEGPDATPDATTPDATPCVAEPAEVCDGVDNDCDDAVDEGFAELGEACEAGAGACAASGNVVCAADGMGTACDAVPGEGSAEVCDGVDNDCNGTVDDGLPDGEACETGQPGQCAAGVGRCVEGAIACAPMTAAVGEICDGLDNDCDGQTDEGEGGAPLAEACYGGPEGTEGVGTCAAGTRTCADGDFGPCRGQATPIEEACDGVDSDCDGAVDEDFALGGACVVGVGACEAGGTIACDPGTGGAACGAQPGEPTVETCNGIDDDCDGALDEVEGLGAPCAVGTGACMAEGVLACGDGEPVCDAAEGEPGEEVCNDVDDDCDGEVDDVDGVGEPCAVGEGACRTEGVGVCDVAARAVACNARPAAPAPVEHCADGVDDDCDGQTDEAACSARCEADEDCVDGGRCIDGLCGAPEVCDDGADNDADGAVDCLDDDCAAFEGCSPCGNRLLDEGEACDDGGRAPGDGCDADCQVEEGFLCAPPGLAECAADQSTEALALGPAAAIEPVGGAGGSAYDDPCPPGEVIVGFDYHIGNEWRFGGGNTHLQRLRAQCARLELVDGVVVLTPTAPTPERGGVPDSAVPPGFTDEQRCPAGQAVTGFTLYGGGEYPVGMTIACSPVDFDDGVVVGPPAELPPAGPEDVARGASACPAGAVATDHLGRSGHVLDQVGLRCAPIIEACGAPSVCQVDRACRFAFEGAEFDPAFATAGEQPWSIVAGAATSGPITHNQSSILRMAVSTPAGGEVAFRRRVSSEACCDALAFRVDGLVVEQWRGEVEWAEVAYPLEPGEHVLEWVYTKDISVDTGEDRAQVDDVAVSGAVGLCPAP